MACLLCVVFGVSVQARDGAPDLTFGNDGVVLLDLPILPLTAQVQPDGRLLVAGGPRQPLAVQRAAIVRLLPDGQPDPSFGDMGMAVLPDLPSLDLHELESVYFTGLHVFADGRILAVGSIGAWLAAGAVPERRCPLLAMFDASGDLVSSFGTDGAACIGDTVAPDGTSGQILRAPAFSVSSAGILVGEVWSYSTATFQAFPPKRLYRLLLDGSLDAGFGTGGMVEFEGPSPVQVFSVTEDPAGRILAGHPQAVARLDASGALDTSYGDQGISQLALPADWEILNRYGVTLRSDGRLDLASEVFSLNNDPPDDVFLRTFALTRRLSDGAMDVSLALGDEPSVPPGMTTWASSYGDLEPDGLNTAGMLETRMLTQPDDRTVFLGREFLRLNVDGSRDCGFGQGGFADAGWSEYAAQGLAFGPDNRLWVARRMVLAQPGDPEFVLEVLKFVAEGVFNDGFRDRDCG